MSSNCRFVLNEKRRIVDTFHSTCDTHCWVAQDDPEDEKYLRECVLQRRLNDPIDKLIVNRGPCTCAEYDSSKNEASEIQWVIVEAIRASHLNTLDPGISVQHKPVGKLKRQKIGTLDFTSLSLFCDDVELLLRDLYGDVDSEAMDHARSAVLYIIKGFTKYVRSDLWREHGDAGSLDLSFGIGWPDGYAINGSMWRAGMAAKSDLILRVCEVRADPPAFSEYTVEFAKRFEQNWVCSPETAYEARNPGWRKSE
jgi:hypothetical protein